MNSQKGFTLLEFMIAFALLSVILASVFLTQGSSLSSSLRSKNVLIATNLAQNFFNEKEVELEGIPLDQLPLTEQTGEFKEPYQDFHWKLKYEEVDFTALSELFVQQAEGESDQGATDAQLGTILNLFEDYLKKSVRKMTVTIEYPEGTGTSTQSFSQLLVNYDAEFATGF